MKHLFPDAFVSPTGESFIDTVPIPVFGRKQPPLGAGAVNPQNGLDKSLAIFFLSDIQPAWVMSCRCPPVRMNRKGLPKAMRRKRELSQRTFNIADAMLQESDRAVPQQPEVSGPSP